MWSYLIGGTSTRHHVGVGGWRSKFSNLGPPLLIRKQTVDAAELEAEDVAGEKVFREGVPAPLAGRRLRRRDDSLLALFSRPLPPVSLVYHRIWRGMLRPRPGLRASERQQRVSEEEGVVSED